MTSGLNIAEIQRDVAAAIEAVEASVSVVKRKIAFQLLRDLIRATPRDTGRAQNAWSLTAGEPSDYVPPEDGSYPTPDPGNMIVALRDDEPFGVIWIVNNVVYIVALDEGSSTQAPAGMTIIALANLRSLRD